MRIVLRAAPARFTWTLAAICSLSACAHRQVATSGYLVSSSRSDYSPALTATVVVDDRRDSIVVRLDSATLLAPGEAMAKGKASMRALTIEAILVRAPGKDEGPLPTPWISIATSEPHPLADSLVVGAPHSIPALRVALARPATLDPERTWLVFRIRADAEATPVHLADGTLLAGRRVESGVRVFACADRNLTGRLDRRRAKGLRRNYLAACQPSEVRTRARSAEGSR